MEIMLKCIISYIYDNRLSSKNAGVAVGSSASVMAKTDRENTHTDTHIPNDGLIVNPHDAVWITAPSSTDIRECIRNTKTATIHSMTQIAYATLNPVSQITSEILLKG